LEIERLVKALKHLWKILYEFRTLSVKLPKLTMSANLSTKETAAINVDERNGDSVSSTSAKHAEGKSCVSG
jgi:hypothetical protein